jgi:tRNA (guanine-N7-)-methyltransferase
LADLAPYLFEVPADPVPLAGPAIFGNDRPLEIEVGFGKGLYLVRSATAQPQVNYLGVEISRKYQLFVATRVAKRQLSNVRLVCGDARRFFETFLVAASARAVHVYFPDPWWKQRHQKRRLFTAEFAAECARILQPGGQLHCATDVADYYEVMTGLLAEVPALRLLPTPVEKDPEHDLDYLTNFERKFRRAGQPIYRAVYERV